MGVKEVHVDTITETVARLCQEANYFLPEDAMAALEKAKQEEQSPCAQGILRHILENAKVAAEERVPLCQDCGVTIVYLYIGQDIHIVGGNLRSAVIEGVSRGYKEGYLRASMVEHPFSSRTNTGDNTPPIIRYEVVSGDNLRIIVMPKGEGAENASCVAMLDPASGRKGVIDTVINCIDQRGSKICPPLIVGVGVGATAGKVMSLAKNALLRPLGQHNLDPEVAELEYELLERINASGIGAQGVGGTVTALAVHAEMMPCHIAALPVGVNPCCHSSRHKEAVL